MDLKMDELWAKVRREPLVTNVIKEQKDQAKPANSNILEYNEILHANKETVASIRKSITKI